MILWTCSHQGLLSIRFPRQEFWSGLPWPSPVGLPHPGIKPRSPAWQTDSLPSEPPWLLNPERKSDLLCLHFSGSFRAETANREWQPLGSVCYHFKSQRGSLKSRCFTKNLMVQKCRELCSRGRSSKTGNRIRNWISWVTGLRWSCIF